MNYSESFCECLNSYAPAKRACVSCERLYECTFGREKCFGDMSITDRVIKLDWWISDVRLLQDMSLDELREYNAAIRAKKLIDAQAVTKPYLTAGMYDAETDSWTTGTNEQSIAEDSEPNSKLTAGKWDNKTRRWVK